MQALWPWLPDRIRLMQPRLLFTSNEHGTNLATLYAKCEQVEPTMILVKVANTGDLLGAYCSVMWHQRSRPGQKGVSYFGTGETFVFTLAPQVRCFKWVGCKQMADANARTSVSLLPHMFQAGDPGSLLVGDGPAIRFTSDLQSCSSRPCTTFASPALAGSPEFDCALVEVIGFFTSLV